MTNKAPSGTKKQHESTEPEFAMSVRTNLCCFGIDDKHQLRDAPAAKRHNK